jgi:hypothetical protein
MKQVKCANCGRTQKVQRMPDIQAKSMTPYERQRQRWFYLPGQDIVLCGGSLRTDGIEDGHDWCLHTHRENHPEAYQRVETMELFLPGMVGSVPPSVEAHLEDVDEEGNG